MATSAEGQSEPCLATAWTLVTLIMHTDAAEGLKPAARDTAHGGARCGPRCTPSRHQSSCTNTAAMECAAHLFAHPVALARYVGGLRPRTSTHVGGHSSQEACAVAHTGDARAHPCLMGSSQRLDAVKQDPEARRRRTLTCARALFPLGGFGERGCRLSLRGSRRNGSMHGRECCAPSSSVSAVGAEFTSSFWSCPTSSS